MCAIMRDIEPISKGRKNAGQGYTFRGIDDIYNEVNRAMARHNVFCVPKVLEKKTEIGTTAKGGVSKTTYVTMKYTFVARDGSRISGTVIGEGMDSGDKSAYKAMSGAHKYIFLQAFCIPTEESKDPENDSHELAPPSRQNRSQPPTEAPAAHASSAVPLADRLFDPTNAELREAVGALLTKHKIDGAHWKGILEAMPGKPIRELGAVARTYISTQGG